MRHVEGLIVRHQLIVLLLLSACSSAYAVNVRGRADFLRGNERYPMNQAVVELCYAPSNQCLVYTTGYDGMYYFNAIAGPHYIRINGLVRTEVMIPNAPNFDLIPLQGN
jgi:hypothetical protein